MTWTTPRCGSVSPASTRSNDVLPAPLRPVSPTLSPARTVKLAWSRVTTPPTSTESSRTASMATSVAGDAQNPAFGFRREEGGVS